jgi:cation diffusion facilitator CzcD-associated flavoprotein CzcO
VGQVLKVWKGCGTVPAVRALRVAVIGAGMAGILAGIKLQEAGLDDYTIYEKGDSLGGTWRENTYPGLSCDVPSHLYSYSFAPNAEWTHRFSPGPEIRSYFERIAGEHEIEKHVRFNDEVTSCAYVDGRWHLNTANGVHDEVDVVIAATGVLHHPRIPDIEGLDAFAGACFHSARWDHTVKIDGARVGVIGTGSTAIQIVGAIVDRVEHLTLFQRTAQWIMPSENPAYTDDDRAGFAADPERMKDLHARLAEMFGIFANAVVDAESPEIKMIEAACRANLEDNVRDPELRERLRPDYRAACKRLIISENFYDAIQQPNAEVVDSSIVRIEPEGIRTKDGVLHELDVLVLATGFKADAFMRPLKVSGRDGHTLAHDWEHRPNAYLSISVPDYPNFFMVNGPNGPVGNFSLIEVAELQFDYIMQLVDRLRSGGCNEISATRAAMDAHEDARVEAAKHTVWVTGCRSWYLDDRGVPATWPWSFARFRQEMAAPQLDAYDLRS